MIAEEVQEIVVEPILITKQENIARRNYKLVNWLKLLSLHDQNKNLKASSEVIRNQIHQNFIMQEAFWIAELNKRFSNSEVSREDIELLMLSIDDGAYHRVSTMIADKVIQLYQQKKLTENFCLSILEKFINHFSFQSGVGQFFRKMRQIYQQKGDNKKIRNLFEREIKLAHDNFDLVWDEYQMWETDKTQLEKNKTLYEQAKVRWERQVVEFDEDECSETNVKLSLFMMENRNESKIDEKMYLLWLEKLPTEAEKLWFLRRIALNFRQLLKPYLVKLEAIYNNDQELLIRKYKVAIRLSDNNKQIQLKYLHFLIRRISRHLLNEPLEENYNDTWSNKVVFFRQEITAMIQKQRVGISPEETKALFKEYYKLWIEVEANIVKDKESVCQLYQNLIKQSEDYTLFEDYAHTLVQLGSPKQAKNVLKRYTHHSNSERSRQLYLNFIEMYGNVEDQYQFYKQQKSNFNVQQKQTKDMEVEEPEKSKTINKSRQSQQGQQQSKIQSQVAAKDESKFKRERSQMKDQNEQQLQAQPKKRIHLDQNTVYVKGIPTTWAQQEVRNILVNQQQLVQIRLVVKNHQQKDYCYVVYNSKQAAQDEVKNNKSGFKLFLSRPPSEYDESSTLFLAALPLSANQQKIRALFENHQQHIKQIRLKLNNEKNYAYVEFQSQSFKDQAYKSVNKPNLLIDGKKILVQHCDSSKSKSKKHSQFHVAFLKNISFKTTPNDIKQFFAGKELLAITIPTHEDKRPKGFAYVEFEKEKDLDQALEMKKGVMHNRQFQIFRSDREITTQRHNETQTKGIGESKSRQVSHSEGNQRRNEHRNSNRQAKEKTQVKDNNYFSNLFK